MAVRHRRSRRLSRRVPPPATWTPAVNDLTQPRCDYLPGLPATSPRRVNPARVRHPDQSCPGYQDMGYAYFLPRETTLPVVVCRPLPVAYYGLRTAWGQRRWAGDEAGGGGSLPQMRLAGGGREVVGAALGLRAGSSA